MRINLENKPIPKNKMGSFKIPDVQKSILGKSNRIKKRCVGFNLEKVEIEINNCRKPNIAKKHMNKV